MRIVLDTNVWISGLLWRGLPWKLLRLAEARQVEICMAPPMLEELERVLTYQHVGHFFTGRAVFYLTYPLMGAPLF